VGLLRFAVLPFYSAALYWSPCGGCVVCVGVLSTAFQLVGWVDIKRYVAGCSVVHMTIGLLGILLGGEQAMGGVVMATVLHS
jgi:NADH:ubiquinone oxidoreductase subunit 4 (subunit M)